METVFKRKKNLFCSTGLGWIFYRIPSLCTPGTHRPCTHMYVHTCTPVCTYVYTCTGPVASLDCGILKAGLVLFLNAQEDNSFTNRPCPGFMTFSGPQIIFDFRLLQSYHKTCWVTLRSRQTTSMISGKGASNF